MTVQGIKQRFGIIGSSPLLDRAIDTAIQVAATDLSVLVTGESGTGKEVIPQIIHQLSSRKHNTYIAVNCGAIPEGTIDSELFGHEKGSFTGAHDTRKGYFEVANGGTIFLDEVAELPLQTQVRLLRVLESGEFLKVGSSKAQKTNVRIVAATNVDMLGAIERGKFREDLYYRLNTVPIKIPALRERKEDIALLFRKFAVDFAEKYRMPSIKLDEKAQEALINYRWPGNVRQLKNMAEQISVVEKTREISEEALLSYLPNYRSTQKLPVLFKSEHGEISEREILYKVLFEMKKDMNDVKKLVVDLMQTEGKEFQLQGENARIVKKIYEDVHTSAPNESNISILSKGNNFIRHNSPIQSEDGIQEHEELVEESLSLADKEKELIQKALEKYKGKRKHAARELGISERTLYRKIKEYNIQE